MGHAFPAWISAVANMAVTIWALNLCVISHGSIAALN